MAMRASLLSALLFACAYLLLGGGLLCSQIQMGGGGGMAQPLGETSSRGSKIWHVFGRVITPKGEPVSGAKVGVAYGMPRTTLGTLETNLRGEFETYLTLDTTASRALKVEFTASKSGYAEARESADFGSTGKSWEIELVLREKTEDTSLLPLETLIAAVASKLRASATGGPVSVSARKDYLGGVQEFLDHHNTGRALPLLSQAVEREPNCLQCRTFLGLALLEAGSWDSATRELAQAVQSASRDRGARFPEPLLILGVLETWRQQADKAVGLLLRALEVGPGDPLVLQELGRALMLQENWEAADAYLEKAIQAGASSEAHLLRARALLGMDDVEEASAEMKLYLEGKRIADLPLPIRTMALQLSDRLELQGYRKVKSLVSQPLNELVATLPELRGIEPVSDQEALSILKQKMGEQVEAFFRQFPNTVSLEQIQEERLLRDGKVVDSLREEFQYLLVSQPAEEALGLDEYRTGPSGLRIAPRGPQSGFMLTSGFACAALLFHPAYQAGSDFRYLGRQTIDGMETAVIAFAQRPDRARLMERFRAEKKSALILLQGLLWLDARTFRIVRLHTDLLKPAREVRLSRQRTEIQYGEVKFKEIPGPFWLPREVTVTVEWKGKIFRNSHRYSDFKLFNVETKEKARAAEIPPAQIMAH